MKRAGARILSATRRRQTVTVAARPAALDELARLPGVGSISASREPVVYGSCEGGAAISEGLAQLKADQMRGLFALRGAGITVVSDEATMLATLLPVRIAPINRSRVSNRRLTSAARQFPVFSMACSIDFRVPDPGSRMIKGSFTS